MNLKGDRDANTETTENSTSNFHQMEHQRGRNSAKKQNQPIGRIQQTYLKSINISSKSFKTYSFHWCLELSLGWTIWWAIKQVSKNLQK